MKKAGPQICRLTLFPTELQHLPNTGWHKEQSHARCICSAHAYQVQHWSTVTITPGRCFVMPILHMVIHVGACWAKCHHGYTSHVCTHPPPQVVWCAQ